MNERVKKTYKNDGCNPNTSSVLTVFHEARPSYNRTLTWKKIKYSLSVSKRLSLSVKSVCLCSS